MLTLGRGRRAIVCIYTRKNAPRVFVPRVRGQPPPLIVPRTEHNYHTYPTHTTYPIMSSNVIHISSREQLETLIETTETVVLTIYRNNATVVNSLDTIAHAVATQGKLSFAKCDANMHRDIISEYSITIDPTFLVFTAGALQQRLEGEGDLQQLMKNAFSNFPVDAPSSSNSSSPNTVWRGAGIPKGFKDVTEHIELVGLDIMNANSSVRTILGQSKPRSLSPFAGKTADSAPKDWIESDTDEQLMLFIPFQAQCKVYSLQITSLPPPVDDDRTDDEVPSRPRTIKIYANTPQILSFDDAEGREPTQVVTLTPKDWDQKTGTAIVNTRFVKFQSVSSFTVFFVDVERDSAERVRIDRLRIMGEQLHEKVDMNKLKPEPE